MGFRINTNIGAMNAHALGVMNNRDLDGSLEKLSSGLRINKAADDASGMAIADSLRSQSNALGQSVRNANDAIGIIQTADKAMDEQIKILDTIKTKATQAAQDGQTLNSRKAIQQDIIRLMEELDNIAYTTSFNGQKLLAGSFTNKAFQIGAYSNETIKASIGPTNAEKIGHVRYQTTNIISTAGVATLTFSAVDGVNDILLESAIISTSAGTGIGALANIINKNSDRLNVRATWAVQTTGDSPVIAGDVVSLSINGIRIGAISGVQANDSDGRLIDAINRVKDQTGIEAFIDVEGKLNLRSLDGRGILLQSGSASTFDPLNGAMTGFSTHTENYGRLTLTRLGAKDIGFTCTSIPQLNGTDNSSCVVNLNAVRDNFDGDVASGAGANANTAIANRDNSSGIGAGVTSLRGAMMVMDIAESAMKMLDTIRADLGSVQIQLVATVNNISITQVNVKASESQIRDVDFAQESANFQKHNILAQSGSFALSQANQVQQNVLKLLQ